MQEKYLPIGTIVRVNNLNKKIMITGYYSIEYQNSIKIYDYVGCSYPEGMLLKNNTFSFNNSDIKGIDFVGYVDDTYLKLNNNLNSQLNENDKVLTQSSSLVNLKCDENKDVVYDKIESKNEKVEIVKPTNILNPFEQNIVTATKTDMPTVNNSFSFDENDIIIEDEQAEENKKDIERNFKNIYDENGIVTSMKEKVPQSSANEYRLDENVVVVGELANSITKPELPEDNDEFHIPHYEFDPNGIVINN